MANILKKGETFGSLSFVKLSEKRTPDNHLIGVFSCKCGKLTEKTISRVVCGYTKTCGDKIHFKGNNQKHGGRYTKEYAIWQGIKARVFNRKNKDYPRYSKLGMSKKLSNSFPAFLREIGKMPSEGMSVDRIDNRRGYFPGNIRWATREEQQANRSDSEKYKN